MQSVEEANEVIAQGVDHIGLTPSNRGLPGEIDINTAREIVRQVNIPVILAGGLSPENVAEAVKHVQPWGVDSLTHTNHFLPDGSFNKDIDLVSQFVKASKLL